MEYYASVKKNNNKEDIYEMMWNDLQKLLLN